MSKALGRRMLAVAAVALAATGFGVAVQAPAQAAASSMVYVVHGIPDTPVDVYVNASG
jgi:hypothetical protein